MIAPRPFERWGATGAPRLAVFTTHPIQYQAPVFRELAGRGVVHPVVLFGARHGLEVSVDREFGATFKWDIPLIEGYDSIFLDNIAANPSVDHFRGIRLRNIKADLQAGRFDAVLVLGWQTLAHVQVMAAARALKLPLLIRGESNLLRQSPSGLRGIVRSFAWLPLRRIVYARMFAVADAVLPIGKRNAEFYASFGVPASKYFRAGYCIENARFTLDAVAARDARSRLRQEHGIPAERVVFVSSGKIIERKRPFDLLEAFANVVNSGYDVHLLYLGEGALRGAIESAAERLGVRTRVTITGFVNQSALPQWYAASDCLVLASDTLETWGLVVNEGMVAGLPVIVSNAAGCAPDLVEEGGNGYTFDLGNVDGLAERMRAIIDLGAAGRAAMGARSREIIAGYTPSGVAAAIERAVQATRPQRS